MASRSKRKSALSTKSRAETSNTHASDSMKIQKSEEFGLLTASETSDGAVEFAGDMLEDSFDTTNDGSALFDIVQIQADQQLQNELDFHIRQEQGLAAQPDEAYSYEQQELHQTRTPSSRSSVFDLPKEDTGALNKSEKKTKHQTEDINAVQSGKEKKKRRRKAKSTVRQED